MGLHSKEFLCICERCCADGDDGELVIQAQIAASCPCGLPHQEAAGSTSPYQCSPCEPDENRSSFEQRLDSARGQLWGGLPLSDRRPIVQEILALLRDFGRVG